MKEYTEEVFSLALRVSKITDGKVTWRGPYNVVELIVDIVLAEELKRKLIESEGYSNFSSWVITTVVLGKVKRGLPIEEIEKEMNEYRSDYDYQGKVRPDRYEQRFKVYLEIAESDLYTDEEKKEAFNTAYDQVEKIRRQEIDHFLRDVDFIEEKKRFKILCGKYKKKFNLEFDEKNQIKEKPNTIEKAFIKEVIEAKSKQKIRGLYRRLNNYSNSIVLSEYESWNALVRKTFEINNNIKLFVQLL